MRLNRSVVTITIILLVTTLTACAGTAAPITAPDPVPEEANDESAFQVTFEAVEVANGIYNFGNGQTFGAFMVTDEGVIVMDPINPDHAALIRLV